jgi:hypothetical protein
MAAAHPILTAGIVVILVILAVLIIWKLFGYLRRGMTRLRGGAVTPTTPVGPPS